MIEISVINWKELIMYLWKVWAIFLLCCWALAFFLPLNNIQKYKTYANSGCIAVLYVAMFCIFVYYSEVRKKVGCIIYKILFFQHIPVLLFSQNNLSSTIRHPGSKPCCWYTHYGHSHHRRAAVNAHATYSAQGQVLRYSKKNTFLYSPHQEPKAPVSTVVRGEQQVSQALYTPSSSAP